MWVSDGPDVWWRGISPFTPLGWAVGRVPPYLVRGIELDTL